MTPWWTITVLMIGAVALVVPRPAAAGDAGRELTLEEALAIALERNPDVAEAESRLAEAQARWRAANAGQWPTLKARGSYDYWTEDQRLLAATKNGEQGVFGPEIWGGELVASFPLYTGGRVSAEKAAARWHRQGAEDQWARAKETLAFQVSALFYGLLAQDEVLRAVAAAVRAMEEQERAVQALVEAGKATRVDLLRAQVRRAELYERQVRETNNRTLQQQAWAALLGLEDPALPTARGSLEPHRPVLCPDSGECMKKAFAQRSDYRAAQAAVSAAEAAVQAARSGYRPTLSAQASYGTRWMSDPSDQPEGTEDQVEIGRAGLVAELPLFDGRLAAARVAEQSARLRGAQERLRKLELQIRYEVQTALADIAAAQERIKAAEEGVGQAEESFRIVKEKYELGKGTMTDVLDAQTALVNAQTSRARALADLAVADARRRLAIGDMLP